MWSVPNFFKTKIGLLTFFIIFFISILFAGVKYLERNLENKVQDFVAGIERLDIDYSSIKANPLTREIVLIRPIITYGHNIVVPAQSITVQDLAFKKGQPARLSLKAMGIDLGLFYPSGRIQQQIKGAGSELTGIEACLDYEYWPEQERVILKSFRARQKDLGVLCAQGSFLGLNPATLLSTQNPFVLAASLLGVRLENIQAGYEDAGLIDKLVKSSSSEQVEEYIDRFFSDEQLSEPIKRLAYSHEPLILMVNPNDPVPVSAVLLSQSISGIVKLLNFDLTNTNKESCLYE